MAWQPYYSGFGPYQSTYPYGQIDFDFQQPDGQFICSGNILPFRFVTLDETGGIRQSVAGDWPLAVAPQNTQAYNTPYAGTTGYPLETYGDSYECWLELGGTVRAGRFLVPDDDGKGIEGLMNQAYAAQALQDGTSGSLIRVKVLRIGPLMPECYSDFSYEFDYEFGNDCSGRQP